MRRIASMPRLDRPREKLIRKGPAALTDAELVAVLLGSGTRKWHVRKLAAAVMRCVDPTEKRLLWEDLRRIKGLGSAQACRLLAAVEWAERRAGFRGTKIARPADLLPVVSFIADKRQEYLVSVSLNGAGEVIGCRVVTIGLLNATSVHPREVFAEPLVDRAASVVLAHNHPSSAAAPSARDRRLTRKLAAAGELLGIPARDHLILTAKAFFSFKTHGLI